MNIRLPAIPTAATASRPSRPDPVEVDQEVERLEDHGDQHEAGGLEQMTGDGAFGEVLHEHLEELMGSRS
mgnify:CR=1 FL=1